VLDNGPERAVGKPSFPDGYIKVQALQTRCFREGSRHTGEEAEYKIQNTVLSVVRVSRILFSPASPFPTMFGLAHLYLLAVFSALVSSQTVPALTPPSVYNNCSGDSPYHLPSGAASTPYFKPQIPTDRDENGAGWEEWVMFIQGTLEDGSDATHSYKWSRGDPTSANLSHSAFSAWAYFPNGTLHYQAVQGAFKYGENADGGFTCSIANNHLTWDPAHGFWNASINAEGLITETQFEV